MIRVWKIDDLRLWTVLLDLNSSSKFDTSAVAIIGRIVVVSRKKK